MLVERVEQVVSSPQLLTGDDLAAVYMANYAQLDRLASLLLGDAATAEEVVPESFIRVMAKHGGLRPPDRTLAYLSRTVVNLANWTAASGTRRSASGQSSSPGSRGVTIPNLVGLTMAQAERAVPAVAGSTPPIVLGGEVVDQSAIPGIVVAQSPPSGLSAHYRDLHLAAAPCSSPDEMCPS